MSETETKKKPSGARQVLTLLVALGIFALAAVVIYPKLQERTQGPVRLDVLNAAGVPLSGSQISLRVPAGENPGQISDVIEAGRLLTIYEGMGPIDVESITYVFGGDSLIQTHDLDYTIEPGGVVVLRVTPDGVEVDASEIVAESP